MRKWTKRRKKEIEGRGLESVFRVNGIFLDEKVPIKGGGGR